MKELPPLDRVLEDELQDTIDKRKKLDDLFERMLNALGESIDRNKL